jgi:transcriptional regulator with XRE-family HTH domain
MFNSVRLKNLRKELSLSQTEMSERLNMTQSSYSKYETNKADLNLHLLEKLKEEFNVDPNEFILCKSKADEANRCSTLQNENPLVLSKELVEAILINQQNIIELMSRVLKNNDI